jgi:hypothetical protein
MHTLRERVDEAKAEQCYSQALSLAEELEMRPLQALCHLALGLLSSRSGDVATSHKALSIAAAMFQEMDMHFWLERTRSP